ncbi:MAG: histidine kinase N-terminal 7TM domain-containing protein [Aristaeellaceae bacterium]
MFLLISVIYMGLAMGYALSIAQRIMQPAMRRLLMAAVCLAALWIFLRTCKYRFFESAQITRMLWYLYYLPQTLAPTLAFLAALHLGRREDQPLPRAWYLLLIPAAMLFLGVMTNDLHQLAFRFPCAPDDGSGEYTHGPVYFLATAWMLGMMVLSAAVLFRSSRVPSGRRSIWLPGVLFVAGFALSLMSFADMITAYKIPEMFCATFVVTWECCIQIGLVPSNTNYGGFFAASTISAQIADGEDHVVFRSSGAQTLSREQLCQAHDGMLALDQDTRLHSHAIRGGRIYWTDSVMAINRIRQQLEETAGTLAEGNELVRAENEVRLRKAHLEEQNRLYDGMLPPVRRQLEAIGALTEQLTPDAPDFEARMAMACVYGAYVKRRCNLALMPQEDARTGVQELALCIRESISYLSVLGVAASFRQQGSGSLRPSGIMLAYDFFEAVVEETLPGLSALMVNLIADAAGVTLRLSLEDAESAPLPAWDQAYLAQQHASVRQEVQDGTVFLTLRMGKAGDEGCP